jgi:hypothetical protein
MHTIFPLFSTPLYESSIPSIAEDDVNYIINTEYERMESRSGNMSVNKYILNADELQSLKLSILDHINVYLHDILKIKKDLKFNLLNSWAIEHLPNDYAANHRHLNSLFSGVVYIKTSENCGNITFNSDRIHPFSDTIGFNFEEYNIFNSSSWHFPAEDNKILLFPSILAHKINPNLSNSKRYSIAFNLFIEGTISRGNNEELTIK